MSKPTTTVKVTLELELDHAAALARLCEKFGHGDAAPFLYGHLSRDLRSDQAYQMVQALARVADALDAAAVRGWPWVETGHASTPTLEGTYRRKRQ